MKRVSNFYRARLAVDAVELRGGSLDGTHRARRTSQLLEPSVTVGIRGHDETLPGPRGLEYKRVRWRSCRRILVEYPAFDPGAHAGRCEVDLTHGLFELFRIELDTGVERNGDDLSVDVFLGCGNAFQTL